MAKTYRYEQTWKCGGSRKQRNARRNRKSARRALREHDFDYFDADNSDVCARPEREG